MSRTSWQDYLVAGLLALLTGREFLKELHAPHSTNGHLTSPSAGAARVGDETAEEALPPGTHLPKPSVWPMVLGAGLSLLLFGVVTSYAFIAIGVLLILGAIGGWIGDLLHADPD